jgi:hypoxanthine phosphoribosyltransferase
VIFPWNYVEDMCNIIQKMEERGVPASEIKERLRSDHKIEVDQGEIDRICSEIKRRDG